MGSSPWSGMWNDKADSTHSEITGARRDGDRCREGQHERRADDELDENLEEDDGTRGGSALILGTCAQAAMRNCGYFAFFGAASIAATSGTAGAAWATATPSAGWPFGSTPLSGDSRARYSGTSTPPMSFM